MRIPPLAKRASDRRCREFIIFARPCKGLAARFAACADSRLAARMAFAECKPAFTGCGLAFAGSFSADTV